MSTNNRLLRYLVAGLGCLALLQGDGLARAQEDNRPAVSLWMAHALRQSIQGSQFLVVLEASQMDPDLSFRLNVYADSLYKESSAMLREPPKDLRYQQFVSLAQTYHMQLWAMTGQPDRPKALEPRRAQALLLINTAVSEVLGQFQVKVFGGRLARVVPQDTTKRISAFETSSDREVAALAGTAHELITITLEMSRNLPTTKPEPGTGGGGGVPPAPRSGFQSPRGRLEGAIVLPEEDSGPELEPIP